MDKRELKKVRAEILEYCIRAASGVLLLTKAALLNKG
jgi:hypothetical protein